MQFSFAAGAALVIVLAGSLTGQTAAAIKYPSTPRGAQSDDLNGTVVADPYRWLENVSSAEAHTWVAAQNALTESVLAGVPRRREIQSLVAAAWAYPKVGVPFAGGDRLYFFENTGVENQASLYVQDRPGAQSRVLIDPNAFSRDGLIAIVDQAASPDGKYLAYAVSTQGSAWREVRVRDVRTGMDTGEELVGVKESPLAWTNDGRGFFYVRTEMRGGAASLAPDGHQRLLYHRVGRQQSTDQLIYENADHPDRQIHPSVTSDGQYLIIALRIGVEQTNRVYFIDLDDGNKPNLGAPLVKLFDGGDALYDVVSSAGQIFFIRTTKGAPRARLVAVDINTPDEKRWTDVLRETYDPLIEVRRVDDRFIAHRLHDAHSVLELYSMDGGPRGPVALPGVGTVSSLTEHVGARAFYFSFSSFLQAPVVYRYDLETRTSVVYRETKPDSSLAGFETAQLFYTSGDGTRVSMFITAPRGITLDGTRPTLLVGDGSFNHASTPSFSPQIAAWLKLGGIYAVANVRGGGEYGRAWHDAATGSRKHVSVDDIVSAAEFLIGQRYTRVASLAIAGVGGGGLLAAAAMARRPELFGAVVVEDGLFDLARFTRFTIGPTWVPEFGSPDRPADLRALLAYSPMHTLRAGTHYPATLIAVGDHDDLVTPIHSYKFAATMQATDIGVSPSLLRVDSDAGSGPGVPTAKRIALDADVITFLVDALHIPR